MTVNPQDNSLKSIIAACRAAAMSNNGSAVQGHADGGFVVHSWVNKESKVRVNVSQFGKRLSKAEWMAAAK